jgi:hypothetical protein
MRPMSGRTDHAMDSEAQHDNAYLAAWRRLPKEGPSTFDRMRDAAREEATRIESSQTVKLMAGDIPAAWECQMRKRDDFVGMVRLIDMIVNNPTIIDLLKRGAPKKAEPEADEVGE